MAIITPHSVMPLIRRMGTGDIAQTFEKGEGKPFVISSLEIHFSAGTGTATLTISRDAWLGSDFDSTLFTLTLAGTDGSDVNWFIPEDELRRYIFDADPDGTGVDKLSLAWTNPDSGTMRWAITVGLAYA